MACDLHVHSTASDGTVRPGRLAREARDAGLEAIALTDHDTTAGLKACAAGCRRHGLRFVPGIEISADPVLSADTAAPGTLHLLGLFVRAGHPRMASIAERQTAARASRNAAIIERLQQLGVKITLEQVLALAGAEGTATIGRPHIAAVLTEAGYTRSIQDAFTRYLGRSAAAYVRRDRTPAAEAIEAIHEAGGVALLAHPVQLGFHDDAWIDHMVRKLMDLGLDGIETHHSDHTPAQCAAYEALAGRLGLLSSGGSDYHGSRKDVRLGAVRMPMTVLERLEAAARAGVNKGATGD